MCVCLSSFSPHLAMSFEIPKLYSLQRDKIPSKKECPRYDIIATGVKAPVLEF